MGRDVVRIPFEKTHRLQGILDDEKFIVAAEDNIWRDHAIECGSDAIDKPSIGIRGFQWQQVEVGNILAKQSAGFRVLGRVRRIAAIRDDYRDPDSAILQKSECLS